MITEVGIQAFANGAKIPFSADGKADVSGFLDSAAIQRVAQAFGLKDIWINTGITKTDIELGAAYTVKQRVAIGDAIAVVVANLQKAGLNVKAINLFAQDKRNTPEGRDFSFVPGDEPALIAFSDHMNALGVPVSGFVAPPNA